MRQCKHNCPEQIDSKSHKKSKYKCLDCIVLHHIGLLKEFYWSTLHCSKTDTKFQTNEKLVGEVKINE